MVQLAASHAATALRGAGLGHGLSAADAAVTAEGWERRLHLVTVRVIRQRLISNLKVEPCAF